MREACEVHTGDLRDARRGARGGRRLHARDPPGRDRRRHRQLPQAAAHAARGEHRPLQRGLPRGARASAWSGSSTCRRRWCSSARPSSRPPRSTCSTARRRARPTASRSSPARSTAARCTTSTACRTRSAGPSTPTGPGEMPDDEPGIAHVVPDLIRKALVGPAAAPDLRLRRADAHAHARRRHRRRHRHRDGAPGRRERGLQRLRLRGAHGRRDRPRSSGRRAARTRPSSSWSTCRPSRWTCSAAGRRSRRRGGCSAGRRGSACARGSPARSSGCASRSRGARLMAAQARTDHRHHRAGRLLPRRAPAREGLRGARHGPALLDRDLPAAGGHAATT